jgi:hypothetical protein
VVNRRRLGNDTEGIAFLSGQNAVAVVDGYDVFRVALGPTLPPRAPGAPPIPCDPSASSKKRTCEKLFDVRGFGVLKGIAHSAETGPGPEFRPRDHFYLSGTDATRLHEFVMDQATGQPSLRAPCSFSTGSAPTQRTSCSSRGSR